MDPQGATPKTSDCPTEAQPKAPRLSQWLWRPWYAKLWWKTAAIFWVAFILEEAFVPRSLSHALFDQYEGWILGALLLFHPFLIVPVLARSEEHTSELQSLMRISYAVFCLKKKTNYER